MITGGKLLSGHHLKKERSGDGYQRKFEGQRKGGKVIQEERVKKLPQDGCKRKEGKTLKSHMEKDLHLISCDSN